MDDQQGLLSVKEAAQLLTIKESTVRDWVLRKKLPIVRVGEKLSQARIAAGLSITELADELGWSNDALSGYEAGERSLPLDRAQVLGERLGVSLPVLLGEAG